MRKAKEQSVASSIVAVLRRCPGEKTTATCSQFLKAPSRTVLTANYQKLGLNEKQTEHFPNLRIQMFPNLNISNVNMTL